MWNNSFKALHNGHNELWFQQGEKTRWALKLFQLYAKKKKSSALGELKKKKNQSQRS